MREFFFKVSSFVRRGEDFFYFDNFILIICFSRVEF